MKAQKLRTLISQDFKKAFEQVDALLTPYDAICRVCDRRTHGRSGPNVYQRYFHRAREHGRRACNLGSSGPLGRGLPLGLHLITRAYDEETLFRVADVLEGAVGFEAKPPYLEGV